MAVETEITIKTLKRTLIYNIKTKRQNQFIQITTDNKHNSAVFVIRKKMANNRNRNKHSKHENEH